MATILKVPARAVPVFSRAAKLNKGQRSAVVGAFDADASSLSATTLERLVVEALGAAGVELGESLIGEIFALAAHAETHGLDLEQVSAAVAEASDLDLTDTQRRNLRTLLVGLLSSRAVSGLGKAFALAQEHERLLHTARIFTEARPVFSEIDSDPIGAVITQRLRIDYVKDGRVQAIEIALSGDDLVTLREVLDRADRKAGSLIRTFKSASIPVFDLEGPDPSEED